MREYVAPEQKTALLRTAIIRGNFVLVSGIQSSEKFVFDRIETDSELFHIAVGGLARCIQENIDLDEHDTVALVTVATGANRLGDPLVNELPVMHVPSRKDPEGNLYIPERTQGLSGILVDDVYTTGSSFEKVKHQFDGRLIAAVAVLDRSGLERPVLSDNVPVYSVIKHSF